MFKIPKYQLYLLQLENYELKRYLRLVFKKGLLPPKEGLRKNLVWTMKARAIFVGAVVLHALIGIGLFFWAANGRPYIYAIAILILLSLFTIYYLLFTAALVLLWPVDWLIKFLVINRAKRKIKGFDGVKGGKGELKIVGIAGSYGKTTMKEVLLEVLGQKFNTAATPESINTPVGVARWILKKFPSGTPSPAPPYGGASSPTRGEENIEIALVEMGEHYRGDIIELCKLTPPDIAVITGINEAHLERIGSMAAIEETIFEIIGGMKSGGLALLNSDDRIVSGEHLKYSKSQVKLEFYGSRQNFQFPISNFQFNAEILKWQGNLGELGQVEIGLLGEYSIADCQAAAIIAKGLGMSSKEIKQGIEKIRPVSHRLEPKSAPGNILVIDDAYNGNSDGAREAIKVLSRFTDRRKIYITPGLVETGSQTAEIHREIGRQLATVADVVILIRNSVTPFIEQGVFSVSSRTSGVRSGIHNIDSRLRGNDNGGSPQIIWFNTAQEAHAKLSKILKANDVILFQNDWGDQYV